ncbi:hypothetical protein A9Z42_0060090 [Trichoderma parareesei]|uniref:Rhodopsin domain-containing protein n=1 Tax=Trichoderma parareesei TaxID=858221 RepID=A0A2H2ZHW7_TRIPA|nr:hypothetical protein A9Z42_0060090 [Trichoderma parareesei]
MALQTVTFPIIPVVKTHLIINSVLVGAAVVIVGFRLFARIVTGAKLWWDDYLILLSMPLGIDAPMGVGRQISETQPNLVIILKLTITYALTYTACITIVKLSILSFYLRVFPNSTLRIATQIVIGIVSLWGLGSVLMFFFVCRPFEATWNPLVGGTCADRIATFLAVGAYNIISDIIILALPLRTIWTLNTRSQMKVALTVLFLTGLLVSVVAVCRVITLTHLNMDNVTGTMVWADFLSTLEANLGIICVSLPMLGPLVVKCTKGRGARKLGRCGLFDHPGQQGSRRRSRRKRPGLETLALQSVYDHGADTNHATTVSVVQPSSPDGSQTHLNPLQREPSGQHRVRGGAILVEMAMTDDTNFGYVSQALDRPLIVPAN